MRTLQEQPAQEWSVESAHHARRRLRMQWAVFFLVTALLVSAVIALTEHDEAWRAPVAIVALWIPLISFRLLTSWWFTVSDMTREPWRGWAHAAIATASMAVATIADSESLIALFYVVPTLYIAQTYRSALASTVLLHGAVAGAAIATDAVFGGDTRLIVLGALGSIAFSAAFGWPVEAIGIAAYRNAQLAARLDSQQQEIARLSRDQGVATERERVARELHDTVTQGLVSILALSRAAREAIQDDPRAADAHLDRIGLLARDSLDESRRVVAAVQPGLLDGASLHEAVARAVESFADRTGVEGVAALDADMPPLPPATSTALLRVCQQALANAEHHACPSRVEVSIRQSDGAVRLTVTDDGVGFDATAPRPAPGRGRGLPDMASRVEDLGGAFLVVSQPGSGTTVTASIDLKEAR
ncbi:sensor histidine kinase [Demequina zhanjiangensis]|uniref:Oxygen sensor histidine kinase NreB n=1 Tax=Demequina zhanjiangensis TaxID=3051659 RepID=A0ABT8G3C1_9MICO|nr:sensor histidine kinase [Demequina sp. SYSU T00b26]MDN4473512.1 sensor histidine kinase [Demequina sp. SYSU T00b26]